MKKKLIFALFIFVFSVCCAFGITACGSGNTHTHTFSAQWTTDDTYHWHTAACEHTGEIADKNEHVFNGGECTVCGYKDNSGEQLLTAQKDKAVKFVTDSILPKVENGRSSVSSGYYLEIDADGVVTGLDILAIYHTEPNVFGDVFGTVELASITFTAPVKARDILNGNAAVSIEIQKHTVLEFNVGENNDAPEITDALYTAMEKTSDLKLVSCKQSEYKITRFAYDYLVIDGGNVTCLHVEVPKDDGSKEFIVWNFENGNTYTYDSETPVYTLRGTNIKPIDYSFGDIHAVKYEYKEVEGGYEITKVKDKSITELNIPDCVVSIAHDAFYGSSLKTVVIPDSVKTIGNSAFGGCFIHTATAPAYAFEEMIRTSLETIVITSGEKIGYGMFGGCNALTSVTLPDTLKIIDDFAFRNCSGLKSITVPYGVTTIGNQAFRGCTSAEEISLPESLTSIGLDAFYGCAVMEITIPQSVVNIDKGVFGGCSQLKKVTAPAYAFAVGEQTETLIISCGTSIEAQALRDNSSLKNVVLPDTLTEIGIRAFMGCRRLESITIPDKVTVLETSLFEGCRSLTTVILNGNVTTVKDDAFQDCTSLMSITLPLSVTTVEQAFPGCLALTAFCEAQEKPSGWNSLWVGSNTPVVWNCKNNDVATDGNIYVVENGLRYAIKGDTASVVRQPSCLNGHVIIASSINYKNKDYAVTKINGYAFQDHYNIVSIDTGDGVKVIEQGAFMNCNYLKTVITAVTVIQDFAFIYCEIQTVYYKGTEQEWNAINHTQYNGEMFAGDRYYYSVTEPTSGSNYWHYDTDGVTPVIWSV